MGYIVGVLLEDDWHRSILDGFHFKREIKRVLIHHGFAVLASRKNGPLFRPALNPGPASGKRAL